MPKQTKAEKLADDRIQRAYSATCARIPINIMDIGKVFAAGRQAIAEGVDDETLAHRVRAFVETIRV